VRRADREMCLQAGHVETRGCREARAAPEERSWERMALEEFMGAGLGERGG
jgi:hypothetical protein